MEKRGIRTDKGEVNRQIAADNKLLKEIKARVTRLYNWTKAETEKPAGQQSSIASLWEAQQQLKQPTTRTGRLNAHTVVRKEPLRHLHALRIYAGPVLPAAAANGAGRRNL